MLTRLSVQGGIVERLIVEGLNRECHALKLDRDHWLDVESGEIREYEHGSTRADAVASLRRTFRNVRALINANCADVEKVRWITLTYAENMTDTERLYRDFHAFWKRFKRRWPGCEYIIVVEPQKRGAWHVHMLAIWPDGVTPFVPNDKLRECWGHGFVKVTALDGIDNVGAYLSAYLGDVVLDAGESPNDGEVKTCRDGTSKRVKKGGRLSMYPTGMQICRHSRGVRQPEQFWVEDAETLAYSQSLIGSSVPVFVRDYKWRDAQGREHVTRYEQYNLNRETVAPSDVGDVPEVETAGVDTPEVDTSAQEAGRRGVGVSGDASAGGERLQYGDWLDDWLMGGAEVGHSLGQPPEISSEGARARVG